MNTGGHRSFNDCTVPSSVNVFLAQDKSQRFQSYQQGLNYAAKDFDRSISPKNSFGNNSVQFTQGWLPSSQPNWKIDSSSFDQPMHSHQPNHADLLTNNHACQPSQIFHCDSGYETWDEPPKPLLSQDGFSSRQSSESLVKPVSPQFFSTTGTGRPQVDTER